MTSFRSSVRDAATALPKRWDRSTSRSHQTAWQPSSVRSRKMPPPARATPASRWLIWTARNNLLGSGRGAFIAERHRWLQGGRIGRRKRLAEGKCLRRGALGAQHVEPGDGFGDARPMALGAPPQREKRLLHAFKPLSAAAHDRKVSGAVDIFVQ